MRLDQPFHTDTKRDTSRSDGRAAYKIDDIAPVSVVRPATVDELCEEVAAADRDGVAVFPWGGSTQMSLGNAPQRPGMVIDTTHLNRVVSHNSGDLTATFQTGATLQTVSEVLAQAGQLLAVDPPLPPRATIGGTLASGASGPTKWQFGHIRDTVIGMKVVQPDGRITKSGGQVVKNVSGYDMSRLHIGGLGSLGLILEASFKLTPIPMYESTILARFRAIGGAMRCALDVFNSQVTPLAITIFNSMAADAIGTDERPGTFLAVRLGGRPRTMDRQVDEVTAICKRSEAIGIDRTDGPGAGRIWRSLADFGWHPDSAPVLNLKILTLPDQVEQIHNLIESSGTEHPEVAVISQPGFGTTEASWFDRETTASVDELVQIVHQVREGVERVGGDVVVQNCPPALKSRVDVWGGAPSGFSVMRRLKAQYDPNNTMNPGRFVGRL